MTQIEVNLENVTKKHFLTTLPDKLPTKVTASESFIKFMPDVIGAPEMANYLLKQSLLSNVSWFDEDILLTLAPSKDNDSRIDAFTQLANICRWQLFDELVQSPVKSLLFQAADEKKAGRLCYQNVHIFLTCAIQQHAEVDSKLLRHCSTLWKSINLLTGIGEANAPALILYKLFYEADKHIKGFHIDLRWLDRVPCLLGSTNQPFALVAMFLRDLRTEEMRALKITETMRQRCLDSLCQQADLNEICTLDELNSFLEEIQVGEEENTFEEVCQILAAICHLSEVNFEQRGREILIKNYASLETAAQLLGLSSDDLQRELITDIELIRQNRRSKGYRSIEAANAEKQGLMVELYIGIVRIFFNCVNQFFFPRNESAEKPEYRVIEILQAPGYFSDQSGKEQGVSSFCANVVRDFLEIYTCRRDCLEAQLKLLSEEDFTLNQVVRFSLHGNDNNEWASPELLQLYSSSRINILQLFQNIITSDTQQLKNVHRKLKNGFKKQEHFFKLRKNHECFGIKHSCHESTLYNTALLCKLAKVKLSDSFLIFAMQEDSLMKKYLPTKSENILEQLQRIEKDLSGRCIWSNTMTSRIFALQSDSVDELERQIKSTCLLTIRKVPLYPLKVPHPLFVKQFQYLVTPFTRPPEVCNGVNCNASCRWAYRRLLQKYPIFGNEYNLSFEGIRTTFLRMYQLRFLFHLQTTLPHEALKIQTAARAWLAKRQVNKLRHQACRNEEFYIEMLRRSAMLSLDVVDALRAQHTDDMENRNWVLLKLQAQLAMDEIENSQDKTDCSWGRLFLMNFDSVVISFRLELERYRVYADAEESSAAGDININVFADRLAPDAIRLLEFIGDGFELRKDLNEIGEGTGDLLMKRISPNLIWPWGYLQPQKRCIPTATITHCIEDQNSIKSGLAVPGREIVIFSFNEFIAQISSSIAETCAHMDLIQALCVTPIMLVLPNTRVESLSTTPLWLLAVDYHALSKLHTTEFNRQIRDEMIKKQYFGEQALDIHRRWVKVHKQKNRNLTENLPLHLNLMHLDRNIREKLDSKVQEELQRAVMDTSSNKRQVKKKTSTSVIKEWARAKKDEDDLLSPSSCKKN